MKVFLKKRENLWGENRDFVVELSFGVLDYVVQSLGLQNVFFNLSGRQFGENFYCKVADDFWAQISTHRSKGAGRFSLDAFGLAVS